MSSFDPIVPQQKLISSWDGQAIDTRGLLRILNENGSRPPLFWIFNVASEPLNLARALGADQPLVFSRSSHLIVPPNGDPAEIRSILTEYLCHELQQRFAGIKIDLGTSCQGAGIVMELSKMLPAVGVGVGHLCMINCGLPLIATDRPALLIYGDEDHGHNPFHHDAEGATARAQKIFSRYRRRMLSTGHGHFYTQPIIGEIVAQFEAFRSESGCNSAAKASANSTTVG